ncbi:MAG: hypothetical protein HZC55_19545 [Verrucomicrobia bacterium]|nr:hypothetical protein [Verrucomicrobiota bacterium]
MIRFLSRSSVAILVAAGLFRLEAAKPPKIRSAPDHVPTGPRELAFPGAEGSGAYSRGGRDGSLLRVTTLEDNEKPGSLRWAVTQSGPRVIAFMVEGTISLRKPLTIEQPFLTLDGSTAPGGGITIKDAGIRIFRTHDIIVRHLRIRPGDEAQLGKGVWRGHPRPIKSGDAVTVQECADVILDHLSASWTTDETISVTHSRRVTVQNCFITEPLGNPALHVENGVPISHAYGALLGGDCVSYLKNYFAYFKIRGPQMTGGTPELPSRTAAINNLVAFYENSGTRVKAARAISEYIVQNNFYSHPLKPGAPDIHLLAEREEKAGDRFIKPEKAVGQTRVYLAGNLGPLRPRSDLDAWDSARTEFSAEILAQLRVAEPPFRVAPLDLLPAEAVEAHVLAHAGAILPRRDAIDERLVRQYRAGTGRVIHSQDDVGGYAPPALPR